MKRNLMLTLFLILISGIVIVSLSAQQPDFHPAAKIYPLPGISLLKPFVFEWHYPYPDGIQPAGYLFGLWFEPDGFPGNAPYPFDADGNPLPEYWINVGNNTSIAHNDPLIMDYILPLWPWWCTPCHWWWWEVWPYYYIDDVIYYLDPIVYYEPWIFHDSYTPVEKIYPPHMIDIIKPFVFEWQPQPDLVFDFPPEYVFGGYLLGIWWDPWYCQGEPPWPFPIPWDPTITPLPDPYPQPPYPDPLNDWPGMLWIDVGNETSFSTTDELLTTYMSYWIGHPFWWPWCTPCYYWWWEVWPYYYYVDTTGLINYWYPDPWYYCFWPWKFHADGDGPQPVVLSSFTAAITSGNFVEVKWISETESNMLGYNVFRNTEDLVDEAFKINPMIIPASNTSQQQVYSYVDSEVTNNVTYYYWLEINDVDLTTQFYGPVSILINIEEDGENPPALVFKTELVGAFPNPFNPGTSIAFTLADEANVTLSVYNARGQMINTLTENSFYDKGYHTVSWDGKDSNGRQVGSGVYFCKMEIDSYYVMVKKMILMK